MNRKQLASFLKMLDECDQVLDTKEYHSLNVMNLSQGMQDAIAGAAIGRKNALLDQLSNRGINLDEMV